MLNRSSIAALATGGFVLVCSWPIFAQHTSTDSEPTAEVRTPSLPNPIETLPDAPESGTPTSQPGTPTSQSETSPTVESTPPENAATENDSASDNEPALSTPVEQPAPAEPQSAPSEPAQPGTESLRSIIDRLKLPLPLPNARVVVEKSERRLDLYSGKSLIKSYRVALGKNPNGHKQRQGDGRTPEGQFYICTRNGSTSAFHMFLGLSYPALPDAKRAVKNKTITPREFNAIRGRLASRGAPLWETRLGGWVGIHGGSDGSFARKRTQQRGRPDWTAGCIAVTDREIEEIYAATRMGTPVLVRP